MKTKELIKLISLPVIAASLCCLSPLILFLLGLSTASFAASLADHLYYGYAWAFRSVGLLFLAAVLVFYFRKSRNICTLNEVRRRKNEIINTILLTLVAAIIGYMLWLYVIVELVGKLVHLW